VYFDSLTITALVIFVFEFGLVLRFCVFGLCGGPLREDETAAHDGVR
jgi:hypothetical protein